MKITSLKLKATIILSRFSKAAHKIDQIESQIGLIEEDIAAIRNALSELESRI